ncbi:MAG: type II toxin-antitoxin system RelE/ParE family toxin [Thermodesulfobacteriota bacterium]
MVLAVFRNKDPKQLYNTGHSAKLNPDHQEKILLILDFLNAIGDITDCRGQFGFHKLKGQRKNEHAMKVSGNYRLTFKWDWPGCI